MTDNVNLTLQPSQSKLGSIRMAPRVLETIVSIAALKVKGVEKMRRFMATNVHKLFGRRPFGKGVELAFNKQHQLMVDVYVYLKYGVEVPKVALTIQKQVKQQLLFMTELDVAKVNVHVCGIVPKKETSAVNPDKMFSDHEGDQK